jgi:hypothetical protein
VQDEGLPVPRHCETVAAAAVVQGQQQLQQKLVAGPLYMTAVAATTAQALNQNKESLLLQHKSPNPYASLKSLSPLRSYNALMQGTFPSTLRTSALIKRTFPSTLYPVGPYARDLSVHFVNFGPICTGTFWSTLWIFCP